MKLLPVLRCEKSCNFRLAIPPLSLPTPSVLFHTQGRFGVLFPPMWQSNIFFHHFGLSFTAQKISKMHFFSFKKRNRDFFLHLLSPLKREATTTAIRQTSNDFIFFPQPKNVREEKKSRQLQNGKKRKS